MKEIMLCYIVCSKLVNMEGVAYNFQWDKEGDMKKTYTVKLEF
jgi:hypothetical protein